MSSSTWSLYCHLLEDKKLNYDEIKKNMLSEGIPIYDIEDVVATYHRVSHPNFERDYREIYYHIIATN